jgi:hypothetical protein
MPGRFDDRMFTDVLPVYLGELCLAGRLGGNLWNVAGTPLGLLLGTPWHLQYSLKVVKGQKLATFNNDE